MTFLPSALLRRVFGLLCVALFLAGCGAKMPPQNAAAPAKNAVSPTPTTPPRVLARDDLGRAIALQKTPQRVVVIGPGAVEIVYALGAQKRLVGRDQFATFPPAAKSLPVLGDFQGPNLESVLAARPDFLIVQGESYGKTRIESWQKQLGVPVASLAATTLSGVAEDVKKIASWLNVESAATPLLKRFGALKTSREYSQAKKTTAFFEIGRSPLWTAGKNTLIDDLLRAAGLRNAAADISGYKNYSLETLQTRAPDFYIVTASTADEAARQKALRDLRAQPGLRDLSCVKNGRVIVLSADEVLRPGPRLLDGIEALRSAVKVQK